MKNLRYFIISFLTLFVIAACDEGIDPISKVKIGPDEADPVVNIKFPLEGSKIRAEEEVATVKISFEASDDIELDNVTVKVDNTEIVKYDDFKDYRHLVKEVEYNNLTKGTHTLTIVATDLTGKITTQMVTFEKTTPYKPIYPGEILYWPFDGDYTEQITNTAATVVGNPTIADGKVGKAYAGVVDSYLTFPTDSLVKTKELSAVFWMKINATPNRAGILIASAEDKAPEVVGRQNYRGTGFRFFRELNGKQQQFKLNVGLGEKLESWNDGGLVDPTKGEWVHFAFTVAQDKNTIYINGKKAREAVMTPMDWTGVEELTIMSGVPRFTQWDHYSDLSLLDELRFFNRALTEQEVNDIMNAEK